MRADITLLLDRSGSMQLIKDDTIGGVNAFIESQQAVTDGTAVLTLVQFDSQNPQEVCYTARPIQDAPLLTRETFVPRGDTPLYDAWGQRLVATGERLKALPEAERPDRVYFVIVTDGQENASREYTAAQVKQMTEHQRDVYHWEILYLGANQDAMAVGGSLGTLQTATLDYDQHHVRAAYHVVGAALSASRSSGRPAAFSGADRAKAVRGFKTRVAPKS